MEKMQSSKDYFNEVLEPNRSDFERDRTSLRFMTNYVISLFHLRDWPYHCDLEFIQCHCGKSFDNEHAFWEYVKNNKVPDAVYVRDVAHAVKHMKLNNFTTVGQASQAISRPGPFDPKEFCGTDFETAEIIIDVTPPVPLAPICEELYKFWKCLIDKMP